MDKKELKTNKVSSTKSSNKIIEKNKSLMDNVEVCFIYSNKSDFLNEDIFFKEMNKNDLNYLNSLKSSLDLKLEKKNLHKFFNEDLIEALDNNYELPDEKSEKSDSSFLMHISGSSGSTSNTNSPKFNNKLLNKGEYNNFNMNFNLNYEDSKNKNSLNNINNNFHKNLDGIIENNIFNNSSNLNEILKNNNLNNDIKNKFGNLNECLLFSNFNEKRIFNENKKIYLKNNKKHEMINNLLKNKFDDDVDQLIALPISNIEENAKLPPKIRNGDWICLYCNNLNYSFRIKCNRCGLLKKSSIHLLKQNKYYNNKY